MRGMCILALSKHAPFLSTLTTPSIVLLNRTATQCVCVLVRLEAFHTIYAHCCSLIDV